MSPFSVSILILFLLYFLPSIVAVSRNTNVIPVILLNLFLGWTLIGWLIALVLALASRNTVKIINTVNNVHNHEYDTKQSVNKTIKKHRQS